MKVTHLTNAELMAAMTRIGKELTSYSAISSQFNRRRDVEDRRSALVKELHKRNLCGFKSKKRKKD